MIHSNRQSGNVLFLILIAVALFGALSYAVTQSTRSTSGGVDNETQTINTAVFLNYIVAIRTAAARMQFQGVETPKLSPIGGRCSAGAADCVFAQVPFYETPDLISKLGIPFDMTVSGGITARTHFSDGHYYTFLIFRHIEQNACEAINESASIQSVKSIPDKFDLAALSAADLTVPIQCIRDAGDDTYHILAQAYTADTV